MFAFRIETAPVYGVSSVFREAIKIFGTCILEGACFFRTVSCRSSDDLNPALDVYEL